jgi:PKD repeat protein
MKKTQRHFPNEFVRLVALVLVAAAGLLMFPFRAGAQSKSSTLIDRIAAKEAKNLKVSFTYSPRFPVVGQAVRFSDTSMGSPGSWRWDFGDGTISTVKNPTHVYSASGFRRVTLTASDNTNSRTSSRTVTVVAAQGAASFVFTPTTPGPGQTVQFTDTTPGSPTSWSWSFGDGATSAVKNPTHAFASAGQYIVSLFATTSSGSLSANKTITVAAVSVLASSFTYAPAGPTAGQAIQFTDTSTGSPTSWSWNFGDGLTSTLQNPSHAYATAGARAVTLTVTNSSGSTNSSSRTVTVAAALTASFTYSPASPAVSQSVQFTDTSAGSPTSWSWNFGDGLSSTLQNPSHAFTTAGAKTVTLTVTNSSGSTNSSSRAVTVAAALAASFAFSPASPALNQAVQFTDTSTGPPASWSWSFGDGSTSTVQNPSHAYATAGAKTVTLTVRNSSGTANSSSRTVTVAAALAASFAFSPASPVVNQSVQFTDTSTGGPTSWSWNFGDGSTSSTQNPSHVYASTGAKTVTLIVTDASGSAVGTRTLNVVDESNVVSLADRWIDWSGAGVPGGIAQYRDGGSKARPLGANVLSYGADPTGRTNCAAAFANAQAACPAGSHIFIPDGTYLLSGDVTLKSNVTWRGQSTEGTIIRLSGSGSFETPSQWPGASYKTGGVAVNAGATKGSRVLTVSSTATFRAGQMVQLTDLTPSYMHANTGNGWAAADWVGYDATRLATIMFMVSDVNASARTVTLDHALPIDMTVSPLLTPWTTLTSGIGFETLTFDCTSSTSERAIGLFNVNACWFYGCAFKRIYERSAWFQEATNCTFEHCYSENGQHLGRNSEGLDFVENCCWNLVQDNIFHSAGYPMVIFSDWMGGCAGNVVGYNYQDGFNQLYDPDSTGPLTMDDNHGVPTIFNLWEGNYCEVLGSDGYWGSSAYGTFFRNRVYGTCNRIPYLDECAIELTHWSAYYSVVGNILGTARGSEWSTSGTGLYSQVFEASGSSIQAPQIYRLGYPDMGNRNYSGTGANPSNPTYLDTNVKATLIRHGNFDTINNTVIWDPAIYSQVLPASLYLASTPSWFGSLTLPAIGPDVAGYEQSIPASARWAAYKGSGRFSDLF